MNYFYSDQTKGFYLKHIHGDEIPQDSVEISGELYEELLLGTQSGFIIIKSDNNELSLIDPVDLLSNEEKILIYRKNMPPLTPIEFDIKLVDAGIYEQVQDLIRSDIKLKIAYTRATFFSRTDPFIDQARIALNLTDEQVDEMWMN
ncbi:MAG TPA: hypothetical protein DCM65_09195 [Acinetobacter junii]|nr:hypothetical protein [Acinetobacter junii]